MATNPFSFHTGYEFEQVGTQFRSHCVFCGKQDHFFTNAEWQWDCKHCQRSGNLYTFLNMFHQEMCTIGPVSLLEGIRGVPTRFFLLNQVRYNPIRSRENYHVFCIPTFNKESNLNNLYRVMPDRDRPGKYNVWGTPSLDATLFNYPIHSKDTVFLLEGFWDKIAAEAATENKDVSCYSWPGSTFKQKWGNLFAGKSVYIFPDNDNAGQEELKKIINYFESATHKPAVINVCKWENKPQKYDVNDCYVEYGQQTYDFMIASCKRYDYTNANRLVDSPSIVGDESCDSFEKLLTECTNAYYFTYDMELLLLLMMTSMYSLGIEGEQIWVRNEAPPGSSKSTIARLLGISERAVMRDTFTGILSGWKDDQPEDASLIPMIANKCLIIKDADALLQQGNIKQILSELRSFYDKDIAVTYRHRVSYDYKNIRSSFILHGTHALRTMDDTSLGERFLDFELHVTDEDRQHIANKVLERSITMAQTGVSPEEHVWAHSKGFLDGHLNHWKGVANIGDKEKQAILRLGNVIAYLRADVKRDHKGRVRYKPYPEVPSRIVGQLTKVFMCAPRIFNTNSVPQSVHNLANHIACDVINVSSNRFKICEALTFCPGMTGDQIIEATKIPALECEIEVDDMRLLGMLDMQSKRTGVNNIVWQFGLKKDIARDFIETKKGIDKDGKIII